MTLTANAQGILAGQFQIPPGIPAGAKRVAFLGSGGSRGEAVFIGEGTLVSEVRQMATRITTTLRWVNVDPLAQTFTLPEGCQLGGVDLWFRAKGTGPVVVQIREAALGLPTPTVLGEARVAAADIVVSGGHTRVRFPAPLALNAGQEYALVVMCDDAITSLAIAELGKWDNGSGRWVTSQPYQVGVLLSSSNASTWTPHQDRDLAFRLLRAEYRETQRTVALGSVAVSEATDLMLLGLAEQPAAAAAIEYELGLPGGETLRVAEGQPVRLPAPVSGNVSVSARLSGNARAAAVLHPGAQLVSGQVASSADYVTRAIPAGSNARVRVIFDAIIPGGAAVAVSASGIDTGDNWQNVPYQSATPLGDGWQEITHELSGLNESALRVRLALSGSSAARPRVRNLRVIVT